MKYPLLVDALIDILNVINQTSMAQQQKSTPENKDRMTFTGLCATQYCFSICWRYIHTYIHSYSENGNLTYFVFHVKLFLYRLLLMLPPSTLYVDKLALGEEIPASPMLLHSLVWGPRAACKTFTGWMKVSFSPKPFPLIFYLQSRLTQRCFPR